ncbi:MAG: hypothetical protein MUF87_14515 [Anaerolineae bacterium]|jgi:hypothetical protein|nr:hypothetical protein [Anaerolineae bacterium]
MKDNLIIMLLGVIIFLLLREKPTPTPIEKPVTMKKDRSLEELSPTYAESVKTNLTMFDYPLGEAHHWVKKLVRELIQPDLTPVEREAVIQQVSNLFSHGRVYDQMRESRLEKQALSFLDTEENGEN